LDAHNNELKLKTFFDGVVEPGQKDKELFEKLKDVEINSDRHPHLFRWKIFIKSYLESKQ